ncbi:MAG: hypothetical protein CL811_06300, partial [Colwelliaceae bacterium]|nr:hypothetical protein [Colwelliaceae bacterium]
MKKIIPIIVMAMMLMTLVVAAPPVPAPVKILLTLNGVGYNYDHTTVTNKDTGEILSADDITGLRIVNGVGLFDLSQFQQGYEAAGRIYGGDTIEIQACTISPDCATS